MPSPSQPPSKQLDEFEQEIYGYFHYICLHPDRQSDWTIDPKTSNLRLESAQKTPIPRATYLLTIAPPLRNGLGNLHGGCAATLFDILTTTILLGVSRPGIFATGGVSRNLRLTYLRPVPGGSEARLSCEVVHVGKRLALLRAEIRRVDNGALCVLGEHEKANTDVGGEKL